MRCAIKASSYGYGYVSFPGLPGAPLSAYTQVAAPLTPFGFAVESLQNGLWEWDGGRARGGA